MTCRSLLLLGLVAFALHTCPVTASWDNPLANFYPEYSDGLREIIRQNCSAQYTEYLENRSNTTNVRHILKLFACDSWTHEVIDCILENAPEIIKIKMAAATIVLGLMPTIVATLGIRPFDSAILSLIGRRHVLAFALAIGSPALNVYRAAEYESAIETLRRRPIERRNFLKKYDWVVVLIEYALAAGAIANIAHLTWQLGARTTFTAFPNDEYIVLLWAFLGWTIHFVAGMAMYFRLSDTSKSDHDEMDGLQWPANRTMPFLRRRSKIKLQEKPESMAFAFFSVLTTIFTACHIVFGTLVFASALFIAVIDTLPVIFRLFAGAIVTRVIVTYETLVLRESIEECAEVSYPPLRRVERVTI